MLPPGLSILWFSEKAEERLGRSDIGKYYFSVLSEAKKQEKGQTAYTPAINLILALNESLNLILEEGLLLEEGLPQLARRHEVMARATREALKEIGLKLLSESPANSATGAYAPAGIDADEFRKVLLKLGFRVAGGQDHLKGKIFRIAGLL